MLEQSISCVLMTALGMPVEPEVNRNLAMVSGPTASWAASTTGVSGVFMRSAKSVTGRPAGGFFTTTSSTSAGAAFSMARANGAPSATKIMPGVISSMIYFSFP